MRAAARRRGPSETVLLDHMVEHGLLTREDAVEVESLLSTLTRLVLGGDITEHFADFVIERLAAAKCAAWRVRNRERGR